MECDVFGRGAVPDRLRGMTQGLALPVQGAELTSSVPIALGPLMGDTCSTFSAIHDQNPPGDDPRSLTWQLKIVDGA